MAKDGAASAALQASVGVLRRWGLAIVPLAVCAGVLAFWASNQSAKVFEAQTRVEVKSFDNFFSAQFGGGGATADQNPNRVVTTQAALAKTPRVLDRALEIAGLAPPSARAGVLTVKTQVDSNILTLVVNWPDERESIALANGVASAFVEYRGELDTASLRSAEKTIEEQLAVLRRDGQGTSAYATLLERTLVDLKTRILVGSRNSAIVEAATEASQVGPRPLRSGIVAGLLAGIVLIAGFSIVRLLDKRVVVGAQMEESLGAPRLASISRSRRRRGEPAGIAMFDESDSAEAESYRVLSTAVQLSKVGRSQGRSILIASATQGDGKSTVAANLAIALARAGQSVGVVDLDLRLGRLSRILDVSGEPGVVGVVSGRERLGSLLDISESRWDALIGGRGDLRSDDAAMAVIGAGALPPNPADFIASRELAELLAEMKARYDFVIIDSPAWLVVGDAFALSRLVDSVIAVARESNTHQADWARLCRELSQVPVLGYVLIADRSADRTRGGGYYYQQPRQGRVRLGTRDRDETSPAMQSSERLAD